MDKQLFLASYYDMNNERVLVYSGAPLELNAVRTLIDAYRAVEAQYLAHPIFLVFDEFGDYGRLGVDTWGNKISILSPDEFKVLNVDQTAMFCVNRSFLNSLSSNDDKKDILDVVGAITFDIVEELYEQKVCFIGLVHNPVPNDSFNLGDTRISTDDEDMEIG